MKAFEIINCLSELAPFEYAEKWDNVGLLLGDSEKEIRKIYIAVDATEAVIQDCIAKGADMLLTHHPLIFSPLKKVVSEDFVGRRLIKLIKSDIVYVAMHTNFDIIGMAAEAADELSLRNTEVLSITFEDDIAKAGFGMVGDLPREMQLKELCEIVKIHFKLQSVRMYGQSDTPVQRVAILPGSGKSMLEDAINMSADVYITGDIDHHSGIDALERGMCVIDAGHYGIEKLFIPYMKDYINRNLKEIKVETAAVSEPFLVV